MTQPACSAFGGRLARATPWAWAPAIAMALVVLAGTGAMEAAGPQGGRGAVSRRSAGISQRKRLNVNDLITQPGTLEVDFGGLYSLSNGAFLLPSTLKFTPGGGSRWRGRTEYSLAFDAVSSIEDAGNRTSHFSDRLTFAATSVLLDSAHLDIAVAPQATVLLRNDSGARIGATLISRSDWARNTIGLAATWTAATSPTESNPAGLWDLGAGFGRPLGSSGPGTRFTAHANALVEKATGFDRTTSALGGIEYQVNQRLSLDVAVQRFGLSNGKADTQILVSMTVNLGRIR